MTTNEKVLYGKVPELKLGLTDSSEVRVLTTGGLC